MWTQRDLEDLLAYSPGTPVLSVYLDLDPAQGGTGAHKLSLRQLLRPYQEQAPDDAAAALRFLERQHDRRGRGLALFSCQADDFFRSFWLAVPVRSRARLLDSPFVKPLANLLNAYGHFGIALVDKQRARLLHLHLGELLDETSIEGEEVRHTKRGGGSQAAGRRGGSAGQSRHTDELAERNLRAAADTAARFFQSHGVRRVLLSGTEGTLAYFREALPKAVQSLIVGSFPMDIEAPAQEVTAKALEVAQAAESERVGRLVDQVVTASAKQADGVIGLEDTLEAAREGRVQTLVVVSGLRLPGLRCTGCGYVTSHRPERCPYCQAEMQSIPDAVELAIRHVLKSGGEVEIVQPQDELEGAGGIGALLRY